MILQYINWQPTLQWYDFFLVWSWLIDWSLTALSAAKSACVVLSTKPERYSESVKRSISGKKIVFADKYVHLGHIITRNMDDQKEIISKRNSLCGKINDVLCFFKSVSPSIKAWCANIAEICTVAFYGNCHSTLWKMYVWLGVRESDKCGISLIKHIHGY